MGFLYVILNLFSSSITGFTLFFDWISRVDVNESFINSYNFFWTTFLYLPSFFFILLLIIFIIASVFTTYKFLPYLIITYIIYNVEIMDFLILNVNMSTINSNSTSINLLLTNNLNKYHPLIFYISVLLLFNLLFQTISRLFTFMCFHDIKHSWIIHYNINYITTINLVSLFLGSWWAMQEGTWGGWWNWDPSEVLGLLFTLTGLVYIHSKTNYFTCCLHMYRLTFLINVIVISYLFIQINFDLVSHNFGSKFFFFFNNNLFFFELLIILLISCLYLLSWIRSILSNTVLLSSFNTIRVLTSQFHKEFWIFTINWLLFLLIVLSFTPLLNYFLWVYFHINSINVLVQNNLIIIFLSFVLILPFSVIHRFEYFIVFIIIFNSTNSLIYIEVLMLILTFNFSQMLHTFLILLALSNVFTYNTQFLYWYTFNDWNVVLLDEHLLEKHNDIYICCNYFIDKLTISQTAQGTLFNTWNVFYLNNSLSLNNFNLLFNNNTWINLYYLSSNWQTSTLFIETNYINNMIEITTVLVLFLLIKRFYLNFLWFYKPY